MAATLGKHRTKVVGLFLTPLVVFALACCAIAQTNTFIAGSGNWSPPQAWSLQHDPTRSENVVVPAGSSPVSDLGLECLNFSMGSGATLLLTPGYLFPFGSLANQGAITVGPGDGLSFQQNSGTVTISGGGTITLAKGSITTGSGLPLAVVNVDHVISGQGAILVNQLTNQATINANSSGNSLSVQTSTAGFTNTGTLEASNGGTLLLVAGSVVTLNNAGGTIQALAGSTVQLEGYRLAGGTMTTSGSGVFQNINSSYYNNITNNGAFQTINGNYAIFEGTIVNNGTFSAPNGGYQINGNVTLKGTGTVSGGNAGLFHSSFVGGGTLTLQQPLSGGGLIGDTSFNFINQSTVTANNTSANLVLAGNPAVNTGTLQASNGATLEIQIPVNNTGGTITAQNGSTVLLDFNGTIAGGTLTTSGNGSFQTTSGTLDGTVNVPTNAGLFTVASGADLNTKGTINNTGTIALGGCIALATSTIITGSGQVAMAPNSCFLSSPGLTLTNQSTIAGAGSIGDSNPMGIINQGNITANQSATLVIAPDNTGFTNAGVLTVSPGAVMQLNNPFNNLKSGTLTGGTYNISGTLQFAFGPNGNIVTNNAALTLTGSGAQILNGIGGPSALAGFASNGTKGVFSVQSGEILTTSANFTDQGTVTIGAGSGFGVAGTYTQTAGTTTVDGVLSAPSGFLLKKGKLFGSGMISGPVTAAAAVTAGDSLTLPGTLSVSAYSQTSKGSLTIPFTKSGYGQVASANGVALAGKLLLKLAKGYAPTIGSTFNIVTGTAISGQFVAPNLKINHSEHFTIAYGPTAVTLTVVAGP